MEATSEVIRPIDMRLSLRTGTEDFIWRTLRLAH
jgi:hypothetical protein